jgi:hypothetical protein
MEVIMKKGIAILIIIVALIVGFAGGYFGYSFINRAKGIVKPEQQKETQEMNYVELTNIVNQGSTKEKWEAFRWLVEKYHFEEGYTLSELNMFVNRFLKGYTEIIGRSMQASVEANMKTFQHIMESYYYKEKGYYPKNSDISWVDEELPSNFKNPYTGGKGEGEAYVSGKPTKLGVIGYESNAEGTEYKIYGYNIDTVLTRRD